MKSFDPDWYINPDAAEEERKNRIFMVCLLIGIFMAITTVLAMYERRANEIEAKRTDLTSPYFCTTVTTGQQQCYNSLGYCEAITDGAAPCLLQHMQGHEAVACDFAEGSTKFCANTDRMTCAEYYAQDDAVSCFNPPQLGVQLWLK